MGIGRQGRGASAAQNEEGRHFAREGGEQIDKQIQNSKQAAKWSRYWANQWCRKQHWGILSTTADAYVTIVDERGETEKAQCGAIAAGIASYYVDSEETAPAGSSD